MRSFSADAAIVAGPSLAVAALAVRAGDALIAAAPAGTVPIPPLPVYAALAFASTWLAYFLVAGLLRYRALSTSNAFTLFLTLAALALSLLLLTAPALVPPLLASGAGSALALRLVRRRPRRQQCQFGTEAA